jgi:hypothetical protein
MPDRARDVILKAAAKRRQTIGGEVESIEVQAPSFSTRSARYLQLKMWLSLDDAKGDIDVQRHDERWAPRDIDARGA